MITLISATNRPGSFTEKVANIYQQRLSNKGIDFKYLSLVNMPQDLIVNGMYDKPRNAAMENLENEFLVPATKFIFIMPEYNGSFPGVLKAFVDASDIKRCFHNKKAALVGVSDGRAGNLRGMEHFTNILNHIKINVLHLKIPISNISSYFDGEGNFTADEAVRLMDQQIDLMSQF
jgi:NAD(P)H-dependent FMN reductase